VNRLLTGLLVLVLWSGSRAAQEAEPARDTHDVPVRFTAVEVMADSGQHPLAAYQLIFTATNAAAKIVGIEGGEHPAFKEPPYSDPRAIQHERVIIAAFNTAPAAGLPKGRTRVATIHLQVAGGQAPEPLIQLQVAAGPNGQTIPCTVNSISRNTK